MSQMTSESRARIEESQEAERQNEPYEPVSKRAKRGSYVASACPQCKRRKIKCPGGMPCGQCVAKGRDCASSKDQPETLSRSIRDTASASTTTALGTKEAQGVDTHELLNRIMNVEWQLNSVLSKEKGDATHAYKSPDQSTDVAITDRGSSESGDMSIEQLRKPPIFNEPKRTEELLDDVGLHSQRSSPVSSPASSPAPLMPKSYSTLNANSKKDSRLWLRKILFSFDIVPEKKQWRKYLELYFDELHVLFPFVHPPTVWDTFKYIWERSLLVSPSDFSDVSKESRGSVVVLFLCLASGRCAGSSRVDGPDGRHSAGWSLYSVARHLLRESPDLTQDHPSSPVITQALTLMVVYLFGLGAIQTAEKTLAQAISSAHILGLHRQITYRNMPLFEKEIFRRLWWSIYVLDRRLSLETGRPFLIQDINTDTEYPQNLSDDWLQHLKLSAATQEENKAERGAETAKAAGSNIPHLNAMISYSKIVGDVWSSIYSDDLISLGSRNIVHVYLEPLLEQSRKTMPPDLCYQPSIPFEEQFSGIPWSQIKQSLLMYCRYTYLKLMIRKPPSAVIDGKHLSRHETLANDAVCCELASSVAVLFDAIPNQYPKFSFPFINYLTNATIIIFGIVNKNSDFKQAYRQSIVSAVRTLVIACRKTWVSGKLIRTISTLEKLTRSTLGPISDLPLSLMASRKSSRPDRDAETRFHWTEDQWVSPRPQQRTIAPGALKPLAQGNSMPYCPPQQLTHSAGPVERQTSNCAPEMSANSNPEHFSWNSAAALISPAHSGTTSTGRQALLSLQPEPQVFQHQQAQLEPASSADPSFFGSTNQHDGTFSDLSTWAMADFDFEQAISASNNDARTSFGSWDLPDPDSNTLQPWGQ